jgi:Domain of unknown function (DUF4145)
MTPQLVGINILADCPDCGVPTTFEHKKGGEESEFGTIIIYSEHLYAGRRFSRLLHKLYSCAVCSRPGVATLHLSAGLHGATLEAFWPAGRPNEPLPTGVPEGVLREFREAEICMSVRAWRGAAALLRSALENVLLANGFNESDLYKKIEAASIAGVITSARRRRAQDLVRVLGNDVLHEEWRDVSGSEVQDSHHYVSRIVEDLYDDRETIETLLRESGRGAPTAG